MIRRLAQRDLRRSPLRSLLISLMFALPLALVVVLLQWALTPTPPNPNAAIGTATAALIPKNDGSLPAPDLVASHPEQTTVISRSALSARVNGITIPLDALVVDQTDARLAGLFEPVGEPNPGASDITVARSVAQPLGLSVGATMSVNGVDYRVTRIVRTAPRFDGILVPAGHPLATQAQPTLVLLFGWRPTAGELHQLTEQEWIYQDREGASLGWDIDPVLAFEVALGYSLLLSVGSATLASVAFGVGARQRRRTLALIASVGASRHSLRRLVLAAAWRLGMMGTLIGVVLGLTLVYANHVRDQATSPRPTEPFVFPWAFLIIPVITTLGSALVAAWLPARWVTRQQAVQAIRRSDAASAPARFPWVGVGLALVGVALAFTPLATGIRRTGAETHLEAAPVIGPAVAATALLFFATALGIGWLLQQMGRLRWRGLAVRLAVRDAVRHRGRATSAVVATLAVSMLAGVFLTATTSIAATKIRAHEPQYPVGCASLDLPAGASDQTRKDAEGAVTTALGTPKAVWRATVYGKGYRQGAHIMPAKGASSAEVAVADAAGVEFWTGKPITQQVREAIDRGVAIVFEPNLLSEGKVTVVLIAADNSQIEKPTPALYLPGAPGSHVPVLLPATTASALDLPQATPGGVFYRYDRALTRADDDAVQANLLAFGSGADATLETGSAEDTTFVTDFGWGFSATLLAVAVIVSLLGLVDARGTSASLAQIGASGMTLRRIAATQAWFTTTLGAALGLAVGWLPTWLVIASSRDLLVPVLPWRWAVALVVGVPLAAAAVTALLVRPPAPKMTRLP